MSNTNFVLSVEFEEESDKDNYGVGDRGIDLIKVAIVFKGFLLVLWHGFSV